MKRWGSVFLVAALLAVISVAAARWCASRGYTLYYGDAEAHLNIARRVLDSRTPGPEQLGTVWLPLPHLLMIPLAGRDARWYSGSAGVIPSEIFFVLAGAFLFSTARRVYASGFAAAATAAVFALNPNMLYLQSTPMTEPVFAGALAALIWALVRFCDEPSVWAILMAAVASNAASLTRYEGWFLIPFAALFVLVSAKRKWHAGLFAILAALGPVAWLAHNQYYYSNALEFANGPYSAAAIYHRQLAQGMARYPGDGDWITAVEYYFAAMKLVAGWPVLLAGVAGGFASVINRKASWPLMLLALPPVFYIWSIHSSGTPVFVPYLRPEAWYNTRYGIAALPWTALATGGLIALAGQSGLGRRRWTMAVTVVLVAAISLGWALTAGTPVTWKESQINSAARRAWTREAAGFLAVNYRPGSGLIYAFGDLTGVLREARIPLRDGLHEGNHPYWEGAVGRPEVLLQDEWALAFAGDPVATAILRAQKHGPYYRLRKQIIVKGAPVVEIYQREGISRPE